MLILSSQAFGSGDGGSGVGGLMANWKLMKQENEQEKKEKTKLNGSSRRRHKRVKKQKTPTKSVKCWLAG